MQWSDRNGLPMNKRVLVSQCLRGVNCGYENDAADRLLDDGLCESLGLTCAAEACPEVLGGLPVPRDRMEIQGDEVVVHGRVGEEEIVFKQDPHRQPAIGDRVEVQVELDGLHLFDAETQRRLGT